MSGMVKIRAPFLTIVRGKGCWTMLYYSTKKKKEDLAYILFIVPALSLFALFFITPFIRSVFYSFTDLYGYNKTINFTGLNNYMEVLRDEKFLVTLTVTLKYTLFVTLFGNMLSLVLALILDTSIHGRKILRTIFFVPNVMSLIIVGFVWTFIYGDVYRSLADMLGNPEFLQISWLGNPSIAIYSIGLAAIWQSAGYAMIIYIAGLQNIHVDIIEAAYIDGASEWKILHKIKLPLVSPVIIMNVILAVTSGLKAFDFPLAMTAGGPGYATTTIALYIYTTGFKTLQTGYATAISVLLCVVISIITVFLMKILKIMEGKL